MSATSSIIGFARKPASPQVQDVQVVVPTFAVYPVIHGHAPLTPVTIDMASAIVTFALMCIAFLDYSRSRPNKYAFAFGCLEPNLSQELPRLARF